MPDESRRREPIKRRSKRRPSESDVLRFLRQYARKAQRGQEPNDRHYDRRVEDQIRRMRPEDLDRLIRGDEAHPPEGEQGGETPPGQSPVEEPRVTVRRR